MKTFFSLLLLPALFWSCNQKKDPVSMDSVPVIHRLNDQLTEAIILGILAPPTAARICAYANIAAYEAAIFGNNRFRSLAGQVNGLGTLPQPDMDLYVPEVAVVKAFCAVANEGVYHDHIMLNHRTTTLDSLSKIYPPAKFNYTLAFADTLSRAIISWLHSDGLKEIRKMPNYQQLAEEWAWEPTPPKYMEAIEPWWYKLRPLVLDSTSQFRPAPPPGFSKEKETDFYNAVAEVYDAVDKVMGDDTAIASFWDCNPYVTRRKGHITYTVRQISPGGHWMGIAQIAARKKNLPLADACEISTLTAIALCDAFITCWETKYHYNLIRPETYINRYIDPHWKPLLETPAFPEYTSGHSVISAAAATVLENYFGESFQYTDSVEVPFGKAPRSFNSFRQASNEAAISRLYGGIHYMVAIDNGIAQGNKVGQHVLNKVTTRNLHARQDQ